MLIRENPQRSWWFEFWRGVELRATSPRRFWPWTSETQSLELGYRESQRTEYGRQTWSFLQQLKACSESESGFWIHFWKKTGNGGFRYFYAHDNNTLLDRSILACTKKDMVKPKQYPIKTDVIGSCSRDRVNTKWSFYRLLKLAVFTTLFQDVAMVARMLCYSNLCWKTAQSTVSHMKRTQESAMSTTFVFFVLSLSICRRTNDWKKKLQKFSIIH